MAEFRGLLALEAAEKGFLQRASLGHGEAVIVEVSDRPPGPARHGGRRSPERDVGRMGYC